MLLFHCQKLKVKEFSHRYIWHQLSKERMSLSHHALEQVLQIQQVKDFSIENCNHAIELFLSIHPNGDFRKQPRHVNDIDYLKNK